MRRLRRAGSIAFGSFALIVSVAGRAQEILARMSLALRNVDFQGSFIYQHDGRTDALRIFHQGGEHERERLISLTGAHSEIVRDGMTVTCVQDGGAPTRFSNRDDVQLLPLVPNTRQLGGAYSVTSGGSDRIAGYDARIVDITPRDPYRYGYRLWLQRDNQLLLRSVVLDTANRPLEQFMFVALDVGAKPSETDLLPAEDVGAALAPAEAAPVSMTPKWHIVNAPSGFHLSSAQRLVGAAPDAEHLVYTDGVASVSIFIEPHDENAKPLAADASMMHGVLSVHTEESAGTRITALGDVPPATVQALARGMRSNEAR